MTPEERAKEAVRAFDNCGNASIELETFVADAIRAESGEGTK